MSYLEKFFVFADSYYASIIPAILYRFFNIPGSCIQVLKENLEDLKIFDFVISPSIKKTANIRDALRNCDTVIIAFKKESSMRKAIEFVANERGEYETINIIPAGNMVVNQKGSCKLPKILLINSGLYTQSTLSEVCINCFLSLEKVRFNQIFGYETNIIVSSLQEKGMQPNDFFFNRPNAQVSVETINFDLFKPHKICNDLSNYLDCNGVCYTIVMTDSIEINTVNLFHNFEIKYETTLDCIVHSQFHPVEIFEGIYDCIKFKDNPFVCINQRLSCKKESTVSADPFQPLCDMLIQKFALPKGVIKMH